MAKRDSALLESMGRQREEHRSWAEEQREEHRTWAEGQRDEQRAWAEQQVVESREFMREMLLRNERVWRTVMDQLERNVQELTELRDQTRAHTDAIFRLLGEFDERRRGEGGTAN